MTYITDFKAAPLAGSPEIATGVNKGGDGQVLNSPTGKFPAPLQDNPPENPLRVEAMRVHAIKCAQFPKL